MDNQVPGVKELLAGATGTGKTHALRTLIDAGITPFALFTEPGFNSVLGDIPDDKLHWHYIPPANPSWAKMIDSAKKINTMSFESLAKLQNINKTEFADFIDVLTTLSDFKCDRCGESFGAVDDWDNSRALYADSLSGLSIAAMNLVVGSKPTKSVADWGVAMDNLERLIQKLCVGLQCHFVLTTHLEREFDEVTGATHLMPSTLGRKLAPKIPRFFDDVIQCRREGSEFYWSTAAMNIDLKARNLEISDKLDPSFVPVINHWKSKTEVTE